MISFSVNVAEDIEGEWGKGELLMKQQRAASSVKREAPKSRISVPNVASCHAGEAISQSARVGYAILFCRSGVCPTKSFGSVVCLAKVSLKSIASRLVLGIEC